MKVLHVYKTYYPDTFGGVEHVISTLANGMVDKNIHTEVFCLTPNQTRIDYVNGIKVHYCHEFCSFASTPLSISALSYFKKLAKQFDVIHYHFPFPFMDLLHFFANPKAKCVMTYHSDIVKQKIIGFFYKPLMFAFLKRMNYIVATSSRYLETSPVLQKYSQKTKIIPIGINEVDYPSPNHDHIKSYKEKFGETFFVYIGVLRYYKGIHTLIEAVKNIPHITIIIAGKGPIERSLHEQARGLKNVHFLGAISEQEKIDLLHASSGFVFPSHLRSEAFGISLLEAAMCKKPLISCEIGTGTSYINQNDETGFVIKPTNSDELRDALIKLYENPDQSSRLGDNAYKRYHQLFLKEDMVLAYLKMYNE